MSQMPQAQQAANGGVSSRSVAACSPRQGVHLVFLIEFFVLYLRLVRLLPLSSIYRWLDLCVCFLPCFVFLFLVQGVAERGIKKFENPGQPGHPRVPKGKVNRLARTPVELPIVALKTAADKGSLA